MASISRLVTLPSWQSGLPVSDCTAGPSLAVYDQAFLRGGDPHDAEDEGHAG